ncbi:hypothetical protein HZC32_03265, partial [Candidatus Woesearchaeota archaeon]|nr:hypothetical protein [Candidatus Woesearchaeota archaeon]
MIKTKHEKAVKILLGLMLLAALTFSVLALFSKTGDGSARDGHSNIIIGLEYKAASFLTGAIIAEGEIIIQAGGNCAGNYLGGNWTINSSITCSDETLPINGTLTVRDDSDTAVTQFGSSSRSAYDLRSNSTAISATIPDLNPDTPTQYTQDWDSGANYVFKIVMNQSTHRIQVFTNNSDNVNRSYLINLDNNVLSGDGGDDFTWGYFGGMTYGCYNETLADYDYYTLSGSGNITCGNVTGKDSKYNGNFTVYYNASGNAVELVFNVSGSWVNKPTTLEIASEGSYYTTFKNSSLISAKGNLTLNNVTLNLQNNFTVSSTLTINHSTIYFGGNNTFFTFTSDANAVINNTDITANVSTYRYDITISTANFTLENGIVDNLGTGLGAYNGLGLAGGGGTVRNITIGSNYTGAYSIIVAGTNISVLNSRCLNNTLALGASSSENTIRGNILYQIIVYNGTHNYLIDNNNITNSLTVSNGNLVAYNHTFLNNNISNGAITDSNNTYSNYFIYNNSFGEIRWYKKNFSTSGLGQLDLWIGSGVFVQSNLLGLANSLGNLINFNTSAQLTFYGLNWSSGTAQLLKAGVRCDNNTALCNISYNSATGILLANVSRFSNYTTNGTLGVTYCGGLYNGSNWTVNSSITCNSETILVNGTLTVDTIGNLTLNNVTLSLYNNFTVTVNATLNINSSILYFVTNNTYFIFNANSSVVINNTNITANLSTLRYGIRVFSSNFTLENGFLDNFGTGFSQYNLQLEGSGGTIRNITFGSNITGYCMNLQGTGISILNSNCNYWGGNNFDVAIGGNATNNIIRGNTFGSSLLFLGNGHDNLIDNNVINYAIGISLGNLSTAPYNNTYLNNNFSNARITDKNNTYSNYFIYNNSFG